MDQDLQETQRQKQSDEQEMSEMEERRSSHIDSNVDHTNSNTSNNIAQYILVDDEKRNNADPEQKRVLFQQEQYPQEIPPPQLQPPGNWPQRQRLSFSPLQGQQQQQQDQQQQHQQEQDQQRQEIPLESEHPIGYRLYRSKTCPTLDHEELLRLERSGQGYTTIQSRLYGPHPFSRERFHSAGGPAEEESFDESTASCCGRVRHWIGESIEAKAAHIIILVLTVIDIILVMLQIGASLLHLDDTHEEIFIVALFGHLSLAIISIFMVEILLKIFAFGPRYFLPGTKHWFLHLLDALIILTSFMLEIFLKGAEQELTNLLIIFRLWRVIKLTGTVAIEVSEHDQQKIVILEQRVRDLERGLQISELKVQRLEGFSGGLQSQ